MFTSDIYFKRRSQLRAKVGNGLILLPGNSEASYNYPSNTYKFRQDSTFLYYFGLQHEDLVGLIDLDSGDDYIFGNDYSLDSAIWMGNKPRIAQMSLNSGVTKTDSLESLKIYLQKAIQQGRKIHYLPQYRAENKIMLQRNLGIEIDRLNDYVSEELIHAVVAMREIKTEEELIQIREACEIGCEMHLAAMRMTRPGITEREVAGVIEGVALKKGAGVSFHNIVTQHGEILHNHDHSGTLEDGRLLLVDAGAETSMNYCSDFTRTFPINGKFSTVQKDIYQIVQKAYEDSIHKVAPGVMFKDIHLFAAKIISQGLIDLGFMKGNAEDAVANGAHALFFPTGLGHQMGLDVHDMEGLGEKYVGYTEFIHRSSQFGLANLRMAKALSPGHVITVEPGVYFIPVLVDKWMKEGVNKSYINYDKVSQMLNFGGIRIEDDILVTDSAYEILAKQRVPYSVERIEAEMMK